MARAHHAQVNTYTAKQKTDDSVQRSSRASDRSAFENALKIAKSEKSEKISNTSGSLSASDLFFSVDDQEDWYRYTSGTVATAGTFQSALNVESVQVNAEADQQIRAHFAQSSITHQSIDSSNCPARLDEVSDWLDEMLDQEQDRAGCWTFEFESNDAQRVELQLLCQKDGQWSASVNLESTVENQQQLEQMLNKRGVTVSWGKSS